MKHLGVIILIIGVLIGTLYFFKDELFFNEHKIIYDASQEKIDLDNKIDFTKMENKEKKEKSNKEIKSVTSQKSTTTKTTFAAKKKNTPVIEKINAKIKHIEKFGNKIKVVLDENGNSITAYMNYDYDLYVLLEDSMKYNLPLIFVIKKENGKVYIEEIK